LTKSLVGLESGDDATGGEDGGRGDL
jgi:hypothetical protein